MRVKRYFLGDLFAAPENWDEVTADEYHAHKREIHGRRGYTFHTCWDKSEYFYTHDGMAGCVTVNGDRPEAATALPPADVPARNVRRDECVVDA